MNKVEFARAFEIAKIDCKLPMVDFDKFAGFAFKEFEPIYVTIKEIASMIRYHVLQLDGEWNGKALNEIGIAGRRKFKVID